MNKSYYGKIMSTATTKEIWGNFLGHRSEEVSKDNISFVCNVCFKFTNYAVSCFSVLSCSLYRMFADLLSRKRSISTNQNWDQCFICQKKDTKDLIHPWKKRGKRAFKLWQ